MIASQRMASSRKLPERSTEGGSVSQGPNRKEITYSKQVTEERLRKGLFTMVWARVVTKGEERSTPRLVAEATATCGLKGLEEKVSQL